jgi:glycosyltransferase involved in cell wall biosynthesis
VRRIAFAVPGDIRTLTGGYGYDRRMIRELGQLGWRLDVISLGEGYPWPSETTRAYADCRLSALPARSAIVIDGLAFGVLPDICTRISRDHPIVGLVHHPLALESGLCSDTAASLRQSERAALSTAVRVVTTSETTARYLVADYAVAPERIVVAPPGVDPSPIAPGSSDGVVRLLSVGALVRRKGHDVLISALARLADLPWRLSIAGERTRDAQTAREIEETIARCALSDRISLLGAVTDLHLEELFVAADLFVLASRFEGYGMAYAEAIAHGLPVVGTTAGAISETVSSEAGILVAPDDVDALAAALCRLIRDRGERRSLAAGARNSIRHLPKWSESAREFARALQI